MNNDQSLHHAQTGIGRCGVDAGKSHGTAFCSTLEGSPCCTCLCGAHDCNIDESLHKRKLEFGDGAAGKSTAAAVCSFVAAPTNWPQQLHHTRPPAKTGTPSQSGYFVPFVGKGPSFCVHSPMRPVIVFAINCSTISRYVLPGAPAACCLQQRVLKGVLPLESLVYRASSGCPIAECSSFPRRFMARTIDHPSALRRLGLRSGPPARQSVRSSYVCIGAARTIGHRLQGLLHRLFWLPHSWQHTLQRVFWTTCCDGGLSHLLTFSNPHRDQACPRFQVIPQGPSSVSFMGLPSAMVAVSHLVMYLTLEGHGHQGSCSSIVLNSRSKRAPAPSWQ